MKKVVSFLCKSGEAWLVFSGCSLLAFAIASYLEVFTNGFSNSDEPSHFVNSYFIWAYLHEGLFANPIGFAENFYISFPKLSLGHWPPLYYSLVGGLFFVFPAVPETALWINLFMTVIAGFLLAMLLRPCVGLRLSLIGSLIFILLPLSLESLNFFMLDQPLTVVVLLAANVWQHFSNRPTYLLGLLYGILAAAAILVKGNGWLLGFFPIFHIILANRWALLLDFRTYSGALLCLIIVVPWYAMTAKISADGFNYTVGLDYAIKALIKNLLTLYHEVGFIGLALALLSLSRLWCARNMQKEKVALVYIAASMILAVLMLQSLVPVDIVNRYMIPAAPFLVVLAIIGVAEIQNLSHFIGRIWLAQGVQAVSLVLLILPGLVHLSMSSPQVDLRMSEAAAMVVNPKRTQVVVIDGSPSGEGAFIAEALVKSMARDLYVVRSSNILSKSNFMGTEYQLRVQKPEDIKALLRNLGVQHIVLERQKGGNFFPHSSLMETFLITPGSGYRELATLKHRWRPGFTQIYVAERILEANASEVQKANFPAKRKMF